MLVEKLESVAYVQVHLLAVEALGHIGQVESGDLDYVLSNKDHDLVIKSKHLKSHAVFSLKSYFVNLALGNMLDQWVLGYFTGNTSIATADDQDLFGIWMNVQWDERDHLLVRELVELSALNAIVQDEHISEGFAFKPNAKEKQPFIAE